MDNLALWVAGLMTLSIFSFLYKDNPLFRFAEHVFVGVSAGYYFSVIYIHQVIKPNLLAKIFPSVFFTGQGAPPDPELILLIPAFFGLLMFSRLSSTYSWLSRYTIAFVIGVTSGLAIVLLTQEHLIPQIQKTIVPLFVPGNAMATISNWVLLLGTLSCLFYFFFSVEHKGPIFHPVSRLGILYLMIAFGALFGATIMSRVSLLIGRMDFLLNDFSKSVQGNFWGFMIFAFLGGLLVWAASMLGKSGTGGQAK